MRETLSNWHRTYHLQSLQRLSYQYELKYGLPESDDRQIWEERRTGYRYMYR